MPTAIRHSFFRRLRMAAATGLAGLLVAAAPAFAETALRPLVPSPTRWSVDGDFAKAADDEQPRNRARMNLSGAACAPPPLRSAVCLIVNDEKKYAQLFRIDGRTLRPGAVIRLTGQDQRGDPDAEGAAFADGYFWVIGSHGRTRHGDEAGDSRFVVLRVAADRRGRPMVPPSADEPAGVAASTRLGDAIRMATELGDFYGKPLAANGVNIEGVAVAGGRMHLGFRGPSVAGHGFVLSVDADAVFTARKPLHPTVTRLALGTATGIRDLAAVRGGILVLTGPVNDQPVAPALYLWRPRTGALRPLGPLAPPTGLPEGAKAETVLVLRDAPGEPLRVLIMYDGAENGAPTEYRVAR